jgi:hypothetical protein
MLSALGQLFKDYDLFGTIPTSQDLKRARVVRAGERPSHASELGTAPQTLAVSPNRMSPAGIPMFYGAFDAATAIAETYEPKRGRRREIAMATFRSVRPLRVLDLVSLPPVPSMFDSANRVGRDPILFLYAFARDLSKPVQRDGLAHTEYVPTQVVTEYVRHRLRDPTGASVDGIIYSSARNSSGRAVVIFASSEQCSATKGTAYGYPKQLLELHDV